MPTQHSPSVETEAFVHDFTPRYLDAWSAHEADKVLALMNDDITYEDSAWPTTMHGHAEVRTFLECIWRAFPDFNFEVTDGPYIHPTEPKAAFYWKGSATHTGPFDPPGLAPTGRRIEIHGGDFQSYRDGRLVNLKIVFDMTEAMRQLGVLPGAGSRAERVAMRLVSLKDKANTTLEPYLDRRRARPGGRG